MSLPWISGVIVLFRKDGKTLFNDYRNFPHKIHEGKYSPPGGKVDEGETSVDSGVRESWEEVRISVTKEDLRFVGRVHFDNERRTVNGKPMKINMSVDIYEAERFDDSLSEATEIKDDKKAGLEWIATDKILEVKELHEGDRRMFEWIRDYREFEGTISQIGEKLDKAELKYAFPKQF